jgi:hypothetical protein
LDEGKLIFIQEFPGGWLNFKKSVHNCLMYVSTGDKIDTELKKWFGGKFGVHDKTSEDGITILKKLSLIERKDTRIQLTPKGLEWVNLTDNNKHDQFLFEILNSTYAGISEILDILKKNGPLELKEIMKQSRTISGKDWKTNTQNTQIRRRTQLLINLRKIERHGYKYILYRLQKQRSKTFAEKLRDYIKSNYSKVKNKRFDIT